MAMKKENELVTTVQNCARCGETHEDLSFTKFSKYPIEDIDGTVYNYWALCPITREPILLRIAND